MTTDREIALIRELGELRDTYSLTDKSDENVKRGERIKEIRKELDLICKPRKDRTPCRYRAR